MVLQYEVKRTKLQLLVSHIHLTAATFWVRWELLDFNILSNPSPQLMLGWRGNVKESRKQAGERMQYDLNAKGSPPKCMLASHWKEIRKELLITSDLVYEADQIDTSGC